MTPAALRVVAVAAAIAVTGCKDGSRASSGDPSAAAPTPATPAAPSSPHAGAAARPSAAAAPATASTTDFEPDPDPIGADERARIPGVIAFVSERAADGNKDIWLVRPTGELSQLTRGAEDEFPAAPTPDGRALIAVASEEGADVRREQIRKIPVDGGDARPLTLWSGRARNPAIAPDGAWIVAESDAAGFSDLVRIPTGASNAGNAGNAGNADKVSNAGGSGATVPEPRPLATAKAGNFEPAVSPDGKRIAFVTSRDGDPEIYVMNAADGGGVRRLTAFHKEDWGPRWSPDGRWIAFLSSREGRARVFVIRPDGRDTRAVSGDADTGEEREPAWSPDGRQLAFVGRHADGKTQIWRAAMDGMNGGAPEALTDGSVVSDQPAWSPDGRYLVYVAARGGDAELFLMRADGTGKTRLTRSPGADWLPRWMPATGAADAPRATPAAPTPAKPTSPAAPAR